MQRCLESHQKIIRFAFLDSPKYLSSNRVIRMNTGVSHKGRIIEFEFYHSFTWPNLAGTIFWVSLALKFEYDVGKIIY